MLPTIQKETTSHLNGNHHMIHVCACLNQPANFIWDGLGVKVKGSRCIKQAEWHDCVLTDIFGGHVWSDRQGLSDDAVILFIWNDDLHETLKVTKTWKDALRERNKNRQVERLS